MTWNWQQPDWPRFTWDAARLAKAEQRFLLIGGAILGTAKHLGKDDQDQLLVEAISSEALTTSEIEGEYLDRDSVQSSIRRELGLAGDTRRSAPAEAGVAEMMVNLYQGYEAPLDHKTLFDWHAMLMSGRRDINDVGRYRTHAEPMQVVSGRIDSPTIHFEGPPSERIPDEMDRFVEWFNRTGPKGSNTLPPVTRAGVAHIYFESIHPFEDGNGRIGRAIAEKALAQGLEQPSLVALAASILARKKSYYDALEAVNKSVEITGWLAWFAGITLEAQLRTQASVEFLIDKARLLDRLRGSLNDRQERVLLRMLREGPEGFKGGLSASNYIRIAKTSTATATRDLKDLVAKGALTRTGERKHARYQLTVPLRPIDEVRIDDAGEIVS